MHYEINNDAFIYEDSYNEVYNDDYTIHLISGFAENFYFIPNENIDKNKNIASIKSELNNDRKKSIIWWNFEDDNQITYFIYNLYDLRDLYSLKMPNACISIKYEPRINVFPYKDQIAFSCTMEDKNIQIVLYNKTDLMNDFFIINANVSCENNNKLSKLYFNHNKNYLIYPCLNQKRDGENEEENKKENEEENKKENKEENKKENKEENKKENEEENKKENEEENKKENEEENKKENEEENKRENEEEIKRENEEENKTGNEEENKRENEEENKTGNEEGNKTGNEEGNKTGNEEENKTGNEEGNKTGNEENKKITIIMIIIIIAIIITLLIVFIVIFRKYCKKNDFERKWKKGKEDENLMKDILSELLPN